MNKCKTVTVLGSNLALMLSCGVAHCQTADEVVALQRQRDAAQARRDIAEAQAAESKAKIGSLDTSTLPKGTGEATSLNVEAKILAYKAVDLAASKIVARIAAVAPKPSNVVLHTDNEFAALQQYRSLQRVFAAAHRAVGGATAALLFTSDAQCTPATPVSTPSTEVTTEAGGGAPLALIGVALQVLSVFKTDKKIAGVDVTVDDFALASEVAGKLKASDITVFYPPAFATQLFGSVAPTATTALLQSYEQLGVDSKSLEAFIAMIGTRREELKKRAGAAGASATCRESVAKDLTTLGQRESSATALKASVDASLSVLAKVDEKTGSSMLQSMLVIESLATSVPADAHVLHLKSVAAGGATLTKTNLFTTNFFFSGGAIVSFMLTDPSGKLVLADTFPAYGGFVASGDLVNAR